MFIRFSEYVCVKVWWEKSEFTSVPAALWSFCPREPSFKVRAPASTTMTQQPEPEVKSCSKLVKLLLKLNRRLLPSK